MLEDDAYIDLEDYYIYTVAPTLSAYFAKLVVEARENGIVNVVFLSREGEFLSRGFNEFCRSRDLEFRGESLLCSRAMLFRYCIPDLPEFFWNAEFRGTVGSFFSGRLCVSENDLLARKWSPKLISSAIELPKDRGRAVQFISRYYEEAADEIGFRRSLYLNYLDKVGISSGRVLLADVGYSGTIQKLLAIITEKPLMGCYLVTTVSSLNYLGNNSIKALFPQVGEFSRGCPLLDNSLVLEVLLSSDFGQCQDIISGDAAGGFQFLFGPRGKSQLAHQPFALGQQAVIAALKDSKIEMEHFVDPHFLLLVRSLLTNVLSNIHMAPTLVKQFGDVDDRISGLGFIDPWDVIT